MGLTNPDRCTSAPSHAGQHKEGPDHQEHLCHGLGWPTGGGGWGERTQLIRLRGWWRRGRLVVGGCLDPTPAAEDGAGRENVGGKSFYAGGRRTSVGYQGKRAESWPTATAGTSRIPPLVKKGPEAAPRQRRTRAPQGHRGGSEWVSARPARAVSEGQSCR